MVVTTGKNGSSYKYFGKHRYEFRGEYENKKEAESLAKAWRGTRQVWAKVEVIQEAGRPAYRVWVCRKPKRGMEW
jgi:hypothetical protein